MADPFRGGILEELKRDQLHSRDIAAAFEFLRKALDSEQIRFGLIGGQALRHHGYSRFTEGIDILTTPEGLDLIHRKLVGRGLVPRAQGLRKKLRQRNSRSTSTSSPPASMPAPARARSSIPLRARRPSWIGMACRWPHCPSW